LWEYFGPSVRISNEETRPQFPAKPLLISAPQHAVNFGSDVRAPALDGKRNTSSSCIRLREATLSASALEQTWCNAVGPRSGDDTYEQPTSASGQL
jgi:hypothetical protein